MVPDWLPDWRNAGAYPAPSELNLTSWAWQFLRRNPEYQNDVADWLEDRISQVWSRSTGDDVEEGVVEEIQEDEESQDD